MRAIRPFVLPAALLLACGGEPAPDASPGLTGGGSAVAGSSAAAGAPGTGGASGSATGGTAGGQVTGGSAGTGASMSAGGVGGASGGAAGNATGGTSASGRGGAGTSGGNAGTGSGASAGATTGGAGGSVAGGRGGVSSGGVSSGGRASGGAPSSGAGGTSNGGAGATANVTVWLAGDSTMANGETPCPVGWGKVFKPYFNDKVTVTNSAAGGRSIQTWLYSVQKMMAPSGGECLVDQADGKPVQQARWTSMLSGMKTGDYLFVQFGINDGDSTCDRHVGLALFKDLLGTMAAAAQERGVQPIFLTPVSAIACSGSTPRGTRGEFVDVTLEAGDELGVPVIDLHALSVALYTSLGFCPIPGGSDVSASTTGAVGEFFCDDHTHFDTPGAEQIAGLVAHALETQGIGLAGYLK